MASLDARDDGATTAVSSIVARQQRQEESQTCCKQPNLLGLKQIYSDNLIAQFFIKPKRAIPDEVGMVRKAGEALARNESTSTKSLMRTSKANRQIRQRQGAEKTKTKERPGHLPPLYDRSSLRPLQLRRLHLPIGQMRIDSSHLP